MQVLLAWKAHNDPELDPMQHWNKVVHTWKNTYQPLVDHELCLATAHIGELFLGLLYIPNMFREWQEFYEDDSSAVAWSGIAHNLVEQVSVKSLDHINVNFFTKLRQAGDSLLCQLDGRFVVGVLNRQERTLRVIVNNYGLVPCFRTTGKYGVAVGTRIAPLLDLVGRVCVPNREALIQLFAADHCFGRHTPFEGVYAIKQGHEVVLQEGQHPPQERCHTPPEFVLEKREELGKDYLRVGSEAMTATVKAQLRHSHSYLMNLTGGMDTRAIVTTAVALGYKPECDVSGLPDSREIMIAAQAAEAMGVTLHRLCPGEHYAEEIEQTLRLWSIWTEGIVPAHLAFARSTMALSPRLRPFYRKYFQRFSGIGGGLGSQVGYGQEMLFETLTPEEVVTRITRGWFESEYLTKKDNAILWDEIRPVVLEGSRLGLEGHRLFTYYYWREHMEHWAGSALNMQEFGRHVFAPLCQPLLTSVFFSMTVEEKLMRAWNQYHIKRVLPALVEVPFLHPLLASPNIAPSFEARLRMRMVEVFPQIYKVVRILKDAMLSKQRRRDLSREKDKAGAYFYPYLQQLLFSGDEWWPHVVQYKQGQKIWERFVKYNETLPVWTLATIELWARNFL